MPESPITLSAEFRATAAAEREKLIVRYEECRARSEEHAGFAAEAAREAERYAKTVRELGELLDIEDQLSIVGLSDQLRGGRAPGAEVSMLKIKGTEIQQSLTELAVQTAGPHAQAFRPVNGDAGFDRFTASLLPRYCNVRKATIYAGSNEIQRNIIAKATLGLG